MAFRKTLKQLLIVAFTAYTSSSLAVTPSPEQIEQFKQLPQAQQEALAKQYGIDLSVLEGMNGVSSTTPAKADQNITTSIQPRQVNPELTSQRDINQPYYNDDGQLKPFGYNVFAGQPTTFTPVDDLPVPNNYLLGVGDQLMINIYGKESRQTQAMVARDGSVELLKLGPIYVAGLTFEQAKNTIERRVKEQILGVEVSVNIGALRTSQVSVFGDAFQPGSYNVNAFSTVTQVLKAAGGIDTLGSLRDISVTRNGKVIQKLDLYDFLVNGDVSGDMRLESGDSIFIPSRQSSIYVRGEVVRPAIYESVKGENLSDILKSAGGVTAEGYQKSISVRRKLSSGIKVFDVDFTSSKGKQFIIKDGDEVVVRSKANYFNQDIVVRGAVVRPGVHEYRTGIRVADILRNTKQDLNANADLNYAIIVREVNTHRDIEVLQLNLGDAIMHPDSLANITLSPRDQILVFSNALDGDYWYGTGQNKTREDWQNEQLAKNLAEQQREYMAYQLTLAQAQGEQNKPSGSSNQFTGAEPQAFGMVGSGDFSENGMPGVPQTANVSNESSLKLRDLERKDEQQEVDFDSRENLLEPVIKRLIQQASLGHDVQIVEVRGAVKYPGIYPLTKNSTIRDLVIAGGGLRESAYEFTSELSRVDTEDGKFQIGHQRLELSQVMSAQIAPIYLKSKDRLNIFTKPEWREDYSIELVGEVVFPGTYTFRRSETISDIIARAGGLTEYAYAEGAIFSRESLRKQEAERMKLLNRQLRQEIASLTLRRQSSSARYTTSPSEALAIAEQLDTVEPIGRLVIDLPDILKGKEEYDVLLENKDKLYIPPLQKVVSVIGEVQFSSSHQYTGNLTVEDYLNKAGGPKRQADMERMYVIRANGSVMLPNNSYWFSRKNEELKPGDTIVVPIDTDYLDSLSAWTSATQILYQIGIAWNAIQN
jgi:protein involved in polysaccharide export with SLBB domain